VTGEIVTIDVSYFVVNNMPQFCFGGQGAGASKSLEGSVWIVHKTAVAAG
jgi:hypothetical protein